MLVGHQHLKKDFKTLVARGRLAHSYIFFGEPEVGKFYFAKHLANFLENGEFGLSKRPLQDAFILDGENGIGAMRKLKKFLWSKPIISSKRLVVINNAENLTSQAQNAILKIVEEPPVSAALILIASRLENIVPPLLSRMQKIYFGCLSDSEMQEMLKAKSPACAGRLKLKAEIIAPSFGRPGRAMRLLSDSATKEAKKYAQSFLKLRGFQKTQLIKELVETQKEKPHFLDYFFEELILELRRGIPRDITVLKSALNRLFLIKSYNVNKRLQLEAIAN